MICRILVVGAGGVGCEIINNLALISVADVTILDNDQISLSNLNRQFLFHEEHISMNKSEVACQQVLRKYSLKYTPLIADALVSLLHRN